MVISTGIKNLLMIKLTKQ